MMILRSDLNIDERIIVVHSFSSKAYQGILKMIMYLLMSLEEFRSCKKEVSKMEELLQNQRDCLNSELAKEYSLHESNNLTKTDADDEPDEGPGPLDNAEHI